MSFRFTSPPVFSLNGSGWSGVREEGRGETVGEREEGIKEIKRRGERGTYCQLLFFSKLLPKCQSNSTACEQNQRSKVKEVTYTTYSFSPHSNWSLAKLLQLFSLLHLLATIMYRKGARRAMRLRWEGKYKSR